MTELKLGQVVSFETFGKNKKEVSGEILKLFVSKKDGKQYCQIKHEGKIYCKQTSKLN